jgi:murein DD-endopeptidase MepM/ murein hydrolase activator NlpD
VTIRSRPFLSVLLASALLAVAFVAVPAQADTESDLDAARQEFDAVRADLDRVNQLWLDAQASLAESQDAAADARDRIAELEDALATIQVRLNDRAASLFIGGGSPQAVALLTSDSVTDAADRMEFASAIAQQDSDLATQVAVQSQELSWQRERLTKAAEQEQAAMEQLKAQEASINAKLAGYQERVAELEDQLAAEQAPPPSVGPSTNGGDDTNGNGDGPDGDGNPPPVTGSGAIQTCPVAGPNSFVDSFGDPRPGGRSHEGIDMIAAQGTPVVAVHSGTVHRTSSSIGGYGIVMFHDGSSDWTFYTHFDHYGAYGEGAHVSAGTVIGYVGNSGTTVYHLHFEYHPGGGAAVDPYSTLLSVC